MTQCSICLSDFRDPVCIPCGHVHCKRCLTDYANAPGNNGLSAKCPDCRASFDLVIPDLTYLPEKYHKFVTHNIRRVYVTSSSPNEDLRESLRAAEDRLARKASMEEALLKRCEQLLESLDVHRQGERDANQRILELEDDIVTLEKLAQEKDDKVKHLERMHGLVVDKVECVEKGNQVLQKENVRLAHDMGMKMKENESDSNTFIGAPPSTRTSNPHSRQSFLFSLPKPKQKQVLKSYAPSNSDCTISFSPSEASLVTSTTSIPSTPTSTSKPSLSSRPIKSLPKRLIG